MSDSNKTVGKFFRFTVGKRVYFIGDDEPKEVLEVPVKDEIYLFKLNSDSRGQFFGSPAWFFYMVDYQRTFNL